MTAANTQRNVPNPKATYIQSDELNFRLCVDHVFRIPGVVHVQPWELTRGCADFFVISEATVLFVNFVFLASGVAVVLGRYVVVNNDCGPVTDDVRAP